MNSFFKIILVSAFFIFSQSSFADFLDYLKEFKSTNKIDIKIEYEIQSSGQSEEYIQFANPIKVSAFIHSNQCHQAIRVILFNYKIHSDLGALVLNSTQILDLTLENSTNEVCNFSSYFNQSVILSQGFMGIDYKFTQKLSVVIDGNWLVDPLSQSTHFQFDFAKN